MEKPWPVLIAAVLVAVAVGLAIFLNDQANHRAYCKRVPTHPSCGHP